MYFLEWTTALGRRKHRSGSWFDQIQKDIAEENEEDKQKALAAGQTYDPDARQTDVRESRSEQVDDNHAIYAKTDHYLDVCTYNDDKRGLISPVLLCFLYGIIPWWLSVFEYTSSILLMGLQPDGSRIDGEAIAVICIDLLALPFLTYIFFRYLFKFWRLEAFTMRRLIVRFNRKTRQVYFLRPAFLGGVKVYDWEMIEAGLPKDMPNNQGAGGMLVLATKAARSNNPHSEQAVDGAFVGNPCKDFQQLLSFWEYIRRFMEDGADAVPIPKRLRSKWPNPLSSILAVSRLNLPGGFDLGHSFLWLRIALTPLFVFWGVGGHYGSLMLSYEPRFPKALRVASGESEFKSLLSWLAYNVIPVIYTAIGGWCAYAWYKDLDMQLPLRWLGWV